MRFRASLLAFMLAIPLAVSSTIGQITLFSQETLLTPEAATAAKADNEHSSYLMGLQLGSQVAQAGFTENDLRPEALLKGFLDALAKREPSLTKEQLEAAGQQLDAIFASKQNEMRSKMQAAAKTNMDKAKAFLADNKTKDGVQTLKSGLQYTVLKKGSGKSPAATSRVRAHYHGTLLNGDVFDSSVNRGEPLEIGVNEVIPGWTEALQRMVVGDKWKLFVPPELAYGPQGSPPRIGPNEALIFEVELLDILK